MIEQCTYLHARLGDAENRYLPIDGKFFPREAAKQTVVSLRYEDSATVFSGRVLKDLENCTQYPEETITLPDPLGLRIYEYFRKKGPRMGGAKRFLNLPYDCGTFATYAITGKSEIINRFDGRIGPEIPMHQATPFMGHTIVDGRGRPMHHFVALAPEVGISIYGLYGELVVAKNEDMAYAFRGEQLRVWN